MSNARGKLYPTKKLNVTIQGSEIVRMHSQPYCCALFLVFSSIDLRNDSLTFFDFR